MFSSPNTIEYAHVNGSTWCFEGVTMRNRQQQKSTLSDATESADQDKPSPMRRKFGWKSKLLIFLVISYFSIPFAIRFIRPLQSALIYVNFIDIPLFTNLSTPQELGLNATRSFYLHHKHGERVGVWQIASNKYHQMDTISDRQYMEMLSDGGPIILYMHGNTGTRAMRHRIGMYNMLVKRGYHCVTFDYRGYGDSDGSATELGMKEDGYLVWKWIRKHAPNAKVFVWGHSLGSAAATHLLQDTCSEPHPPSGLILDAPFTKMEDAAVNHIISAPYWPIVSYLQYTCISHLKEKFSTIDKISGVSCKILIIHGTQDIIIPFELGKKLYEHAVKNRKPEDGDVLFLDCGPQQHRTNYLSPLLPDALTSFIDNS